jgi:hypothetical protein
VRPEEVVEEREREDRASKDEAIDIVGLGIVIGVAMTAIFL